jgi:ABC-2 type transport system permease protein
MITGLMNSSMTQLLVSAELLRKVAFPAWAPVLAGSAVQFVQVGLELGVLVGMMLILGNVGWTWLLAIPVLAAGACFGQGVGLALSITNARRGDVMHTTAIVLALLYFLTPVLYPLNLAQEQGGVMNLVVTLNPITWYVSMMHDIMYSLVLPPLPRLIGLLVLGYATLWGGFVFFRSREADVGEIL